MASAAKTFYQEFSTENLEKLYVEHIANGSAIGIDRISRVVFEKSLSSEIELIAKKSLDNSYKFSQYKEKLISKGAGKAPRVISIPTYRDRITLRACCNVLQMVFSESINLKIPQMVIAEIKAAIATESFGFFIKVDIEKFYPSIIHLILFRKVKTKVRKAEIVSLLENAVSTTTVAYPDKSIAKEKKGVPQGLSISNILAEIYLHKFDHEMTVGSDIAYFRYVDDVLIFCKNNPDDLFNALCKKAKDQYGLVVHPITDSGSKSRIGTIDESFSFLGYQFKDQKAEVKIESVRRLEESLANIFTTYKYKVSAIRAEPMDSYERSRRLALAKTILFWRLNLRITGCVFEHARKGWIFYFSQIDERNIRQLWNLDKTVKRLFQRFSVEPSPFKIKSFVRTFFEARRITGKLNGYIPNFDTASISEQKKILEQYFGYLSLAGLPDEAITKLFNQRIRRITQELETDIQDVS